MSALDHIPDNINTLSPLGYKLVIKKLPKTIFWLQTANIPSLSITPVYHENPFVKIPFSGEHIDYGPFTMSFKVDEDLTNWRELHTWLRGLGFPDKYDEYANLKAQSRWEGEGLVSDMSLIILTNLKNPNIEVTFRDAFPINLGDVQFSTAQDDVIFVNCTAEFKFTLYDVSVIPKVDAQ